MPEGEQVKRGLQVTDECRCADSEQPTMLWQLEGLSCELGINSLPVSSNGHPAAYIALCGQYTARFKLGALNKNTSVLVNGLQHTGKYGSY